MWTIKPILYLFIFLFISPVFADWAITPDGVGNPVGARSIKPDWLLTNDETFKVDNWSPNMVLAEDEVSLRKMTGQEKADEVKAKALQRKKDNAVRAIQVARDNAELETSTLPEVVDYRTLRDQ